MYKFLINTFLSILIIFLPSCAPLTSKSTEYVTIATLDSFSPHQSVFGYPAQVTDGKLLLSVEEYQPRCYKLGDVRKLKFTFTNLTNETIKFVSDLDIAMNQRGEGGNISVFMTDEKGKGLYTLGDLSIADYFFMPSSIYTKIQPNKNKDFLLDFYFPSLLSDSKSDTPIFTEPISGMYYLRFLYMGYDFDEVGGWQGYTSSNNLAICLST